jgi:hypothetical protein
MHIQTTYLTHPSVTVAYQHITYLAYAAIPVVVNRNILYLNNRTVVVILHIWVVVVTRVESHVYEAVADRGRLSGWLHVKIEFPIWIHGECDAHFVKNDGISITVDGCIRVMGRSAHHRGQHYCEH